MKSLPLFFPHYSLLIIHPCYAGNVEKREVLKIKRNVDFTLFSKYNYSEKEKRK